MVTNLSLVGVAAELLGRQADIPQMLARPTKVFLLAVSAVFAVALFLPAVAYIHVIDDAPSSYYPIATMLWQLLLLGMESLVFLALWFVISSPALATLAAPFLARFIWFRVAAVALCLPAGWFSAVLAISEPSAFTYGFYVVGGSFTVVGVGMLLLLIADLAEGPRHESQQQMPGGVRGVGRSLNGGAAGV